LNKSGDKKQYFSFMLRVWQANDEGESVWRASLESPHTGERIGFASLEALFIFLWRRVGMATTGTTIKVIEQKSIQVSRTFDPEQEV
jgi:hypothetical protein